jgi:hypothetical protein
MSGNIVWCQDKAYPERYHDICPKCPSARLDTLRCPCGEKESLSNFFSVFGDKNFYCKSCKVAKQSLLNGELDACSTLEEGEAVLSRWKGMNETKE